MDNAWESLGRFFQPFIWLALIVYELVDFLSAWLDDWMKADPVRAIVLAGGRRLLGLS